jgi:serine protease
VCRSALSDGRPPPPAAAGARLASVADPRVVSVTRWEDVGTDSLWAITSRNDLTVWAGLRLSNGQPAFAGGRSEVSRTEAANAWSSIARSTGTVVQTADTLLPMARLRVPNIQALAALRSHAQVAFVEPAYFPRNPKLSHWGSSIASGCATNAFPNHASLSTVFPGDLVPSPYVLMNVPAAWQRSSGAGVTIGLVDTGVDGGHPQMSPTGFVGGMSGGRTLVTAATAPHPGNTDACGHGTRMASTMTAPRDGMSILGVAWRANLYSVRATNDVIIDGVIAGGDEVGWVVQGIRNASLAAKIVAMALGTTYHYSSIEWEIAHWHGLDRLFVVAAGTFVCAGPWQVVFPGTLSTVTTVTGVNEFGVPPCNVSSGPAVDFAAYISQPAAGRGWPSTPPLQDFGGSSNATAIIAGLAAMAQSTMPGATRAMILGRLISASSDAWPAPSSSVGHGVPNAICVVGGVCRATIVGPTLIESSGTYSWTLTPRLAVGPVSYSWGSGELTQTITRYVNVHPGMPPYGISLTGVVTDLTDGRTVPAPPITVTVRHPGGCPQCP